MPEELEDEYQVGDTKLTETEVRKRLALYTDTRITDELYSFGNSMVDKALERFHGLDTKAAAIGAYSIGVITVLASTVENWNLSLLVSVIVAFVSAAFAVFALRLREIDGFSQDEWLKAEHLSDVEALRRYHVINMWGVIDSHQIASKSKVYLIAIAEALLLISAFCLVLSFIWVK